MNAGLISDIQRKTTADVHVKTVLHPSAQLYEVAVLSSFNRLHMWAFEDELECIAGALLAIV